MPTTRPSRARFVAWAGGVVDLEDLDALKPICEPVRSRIQPGAEQHELVQAGLKLGEDDLVQDLRARDFIGVGPGHFAFHEGHEHRARAGALGERRNVEAAEEPAGQLVRAPHGAVGLQRPRRPQRRRRLGRASREERVASALAERHARTLAARDGIGNPVMTCAAVLGRWAARRG